MTPTPSPDDCPHCEHDRGICLECGADVTDRLAGEADWLMDAARDRAAAGH